MMTVKPVLWYMCSVLLYTLNTLKKGCIGKETKKKPIWARQTGKFGGWVCFATGLYRPKERPLLTA